MDVLQTLKILNHTHYETAEACFFADSGAIGKNLRNGKCHLCTRTENVGLTHRPSTGARARQLDLAFSGVYTDLLGKHQGKGVLLGKAMEAQEIVMKSGFYVIKCYFNINFW